MSLKYVFLVLLGLYSLVNVVYASSPADHILISEVQYNASQTGIDTDYEWIELYNPTTGYINLSGWMIQDNSDGPYVFGSLVIVPGQYLVLVNSGTGFMVNYPFITPNVIIKQKVSGGLRLSDAGPDSIFLKKPDGSTGDYVSWVGYASSIAGKSICRVNSTDTDGASDWLSNCSPTPQSGTLTFSPYLTLLGESLSQIPIHTSYSDSGALYTSAQGTGIVFSTGFVVTDSVGPSTLMYYYTDGSGNSATPVSRIVDIVPTYTLSYVTSSGGFISGSSLQVNLLSGSSGSMVQAIVTTGYMFSGWSDGSIQNPRIDESIIANKTITAVFTDHSVPTITILGETNIMLHIGDAYTESGALWSDNGLSGSAFTSGTVTTSSTGVYIIMYYYIDPNGNMGTGTRTVTVTSLVCSPGYQLNGSGTICQPCDLGTYNAMTGGICHFAGPGFFVGSTGAISSMSCTPGSYTSSTGQSLCISAPLGSYVPMHGSTSPILCPADTFSDILGSTSCVPCRSGYYSSTGSISCIDTQGPVLTLIGTTGVVVEANLGFYIDSGAWWTDDIDGLGSSLTGAWGVTGSFTVSGTVDVSQPGVYYLYYNKVDLSGNSAQATRKIVVQDTVVPIVTLVGSDIMYVKQGDVSGYSELGAVWIDTMMGSGYINKASSGSVNIDVAGTYVLSYSYTDAAGNKSNVVTRTVIVEPTIASPLRNGGGGSTNISARTLDSETLLIGGSSKIIISSRGNHVNPVQHQGSCYGIMTGFEIIDSHKISTDAEFRSSLAFMYSYKLTKFNVVDEFSPFTYVTREQAAKIFSNFAMYVLCRKPDFSLKIDYSDMMDVDPSLKSYVVLAYQLGLMKGGEGKFRPFDTISKAEFNAILVRMLLRGYLDESGSIWYHHYDGVAVELGIVSEGSGLDPVLRHDAALMLFRVYQNQ